MMSVSGVSKRAYCTTPSLTFSLPFFLARSATTAAVGARVQRGSDHAEGARNRNSLWVAAFNRCATIASTRSPATSTFSRSCPPRGCT